MNYSQILDFALSSTTMPNTFVLLIASGVCVYRVLKLWKYREELGARWRNLADFTILVCAIFLQSCAATWSRMGRPLGLYELHDLDELLLVVRLLIFFAAIRLIYRITYLRWQAHVTYMAVLGAVILAILSGIFALHYKLYCCP